MNGNATLETNRTRERIAELLQELPPDSLNVLEQFALFMKYQKPMVFAKQIREEKVPYLYPTVPVPAASLVSWSNLLDVGYEGDALADTEALYDDV